MKKQNQKKQDYGVIIMNEKMIRRYARMLATVGINVQKGQKVLVEACIEGHEFANIFAQECYKEGASEVIIHYLDLPFLKTKAQYQSDEDVIVEIKLKYNTNNFEVIYDNYKEILES